MGVGFAGAKDGGVAGEFRMVWSVRIQLGLHCKGHAVACEELEAGLVAEDFQQSSGGGGVSVSHLVKRSCLGVVEAEVLVIAADHSLRDGRSRSAGRRAAGRCGELPLAQEDGLAEVEGGTSDRQDLAGGYKAAVNFRYAVGKDAEYVVLDVLCRESVQVEIYVMGQVADGGLVSGGGVFDLYSVVLGHGKGEESLDGSGETVGSVLEDTAHQNGILSNFFHIPNGVVKAFGSSVKGVLAVVLGKLILFAVQGEGGVSNAVCITAESGSYRIAAESLVLLDIVVVAHYVGVVAVFVGSVYSNDVTCQIGDLGGNPAVCNGVEGYLFAVNLRFKIRFVQEIARSLCLGV